MKKCRSYCGWGSPNEPVAGDLGRRAGNLVANPHVLLRPPSQAPELRGYIRILSPKLDHAGNIVSRLSAGNSYISQSQLQPAMRWHIENFDMSRIVFD